MKPFLRCVLLVITFCLFSACDRPHLTGVGFEKIDTSRDPEQTPVTTNDPIVITFKNGSFTLIPKATYRLSRVVVGRESYSGGWEAIISPVDLAIVWGKLAEPYSDKYVSYSQSNRWYFFKTKADSPLDTSYVSTHSGNNHIVPVNENVARAVNAVRKKDKVILEGFLVNMTGTYRGKVVMWNSSLSRADTGNGSCEIFYVTKARIDSRVYE